MSGSSRRVSDWIVITGAPAGSVAYRAKLSGPVDVSQTWSWVGRGGVQGDPGERERKPGCWTFSIEAGAAVKRGGQRMQGSIEQGRVDAIAS